MTGAAGVFLAIAAIAAVVDWVAVARRPSSAEYAAKPAVVAALIVVALTLDPANDAQRAWFVAALVLSLAGDVFLLPKPDAFVPGLASFLLAHVAYVVGFAQLDANPNAGVLVLVVLAAVAARVGGAVRRTEPTLLAPVVVYIAVIATMVAAAVWFGDALAIVGALLFATSDSTLALDRFDEHRSWMPLAVIVTYHLAQALLVLSLVP